MHYLSRSRGYTSAIIVVAIVIAWQHQTLLSFAQAVTEPLQATIFVAADTPDVAQSDETDEDGCRDVHETVSMALSANLSADVRGVLKAHQRIARKTEEFIPINDYFLSYFSASMGIENVCDDSCRIVEESAGCLRAMLQGPADCQQDGRQLTCAVEYHCRVECIPGEIVHHFPEVLENRKLADEFLPGDLGDIWEVLTEPEPTPERTVHADEPANHSAADESPPEAQHTEETKSETEELDEQDEEGEEEEISEPEEDVPSEMPTDNPEEIEEVETTDEPDMTELVAPTDDEHTPDTAHPEPEILEPAPVQPETPDVPLHSDEFSEPDGMWHRPKGWDEAWQRVDDFERELEEIDTFLDSVRIDESCLACEKFWQTLETATSWAEMEIPQACFDCELFGPTLNESFEQHDADPVWEEEWPYDEKREQMHHDNKDWYDSNRTVPEFDEITP